MSANAAQEPEQSPLSLLVLVLVLVLVSRRAWLLPISGTLHQNRCYFGTKNKNRCYFGTKNKGMGGSLDVLFRLVDV